MTVGGSWTGRRCNTALLHQTNMTKKIYPDSYYYTEDEWSRIGMQGPLPEDRKRPKKVLAEYEGQGEEIGSTDGIFLQEVMDHNNNNQQ